MAGYTDDYNPMRSANAAQNTLSSPWEAQRVAAVSSGAQASQPEPMLCSTLSEVEILTATLEVRIMKMFGRVAPSQPNDTDACSSAPGGRDFDSRLHSVLSILARTSDTLASLERFI